MFATLLGPLPRPPLPDDAGPEALLDAILDVQREHGLEPLSSAGWDTSGDPVAAWRQAADRSDRLVKATLIGPYSSTAAVATVRRTIDALTDAGCRWIEVHEPAAVAIGASAEARARFVAAHQDLTRDLPDVHLSLAITGGSADGAGIETILAGTYASLAVDLIDGPDNWRLIADAPGDRGIVCGVVAPRAGSDDGPELLLWAAGYAASTGGRGAARVGLATASSLAALSWDEATEKVRRLGEAARLATAPREERADAIDPRAIDSRSAAHGRFMPRPPSSRPAERRRPNR